jgi:hypothetical protein
VKSPRNFPSPNNAGVGAIAIATLARIRSDQFVKSFRVRLYICMCRRPVCRRAACERRRRRSCSFHTQSYHVR